MVAGLDDFLAERSSLTKRQVEVLMLQVFAGNTTEGMEDRGKRHIIAAVSEGSYYRVLSQAKKNVSEALYTMLLCSRMGILESSDMVRLLAMINNLHVEADGKSDEVTSLIDALVRKLVMI